ncbi:hypothetical protein EJB05_13490, partial [Eragrostis curvula]
MKRVKSTSYNTGSSRSPGMAGGGFVAADSSACDYGGRVTFSVVMTCLMAASCGIIYGYDNGISGAY